jgi:hypothetical protein
VCSVFSVSCMLWEDIIPFRGLVLFERAIAGCWEDGDSCEVYCILRVYHWVVLSSLQKPVSKQATPPGHDQTFCFQVSLQTLGRSSPPDLFVVENGMSCVDGFLSVSSGESYSISSRCFRFHLLSARLIAYQLCQSRSHDSL